MCGSLLRSCTHLTSGSQLSFNAKLADVWRTEMWIRQRHKQFDLNLQWNLIKIDFSFLLHSLSCLLPTNPTKEPTLRWTWTICALARCFYDPIFNRYRVTDERETFFFCSACFISLLYSEWYRVFISIGEWMISLSSPIFLLVFRRTNILLPNNISLARRQRNN